MAKYLDDNGLLYFWGVLKALFSNKVDKETGKGLSTNDFTTNEKTKLAGIANGAEANVNADWNAATGDAAILNKPNIPTSTSDLTNDSGFITSAALSDYALKTDISNAYIFKGSVATYSALPSSGQKAGDVWDVEADGMNYAWTGTAWDALGSTFSIVSITNAEIDTIVAS